MKKFVLFFCIIFSIILLAGCSDTADSNSADSGNEKMNEEEILGTWQGTSENQTLILTFEDKDSYTEKIITDTESTEIDGDYDIYSNNITLIPKTIDGQDEETYISENNLSEKDMAADDYVFNDTDATFSINGDTLSLTVNNQTTEFTKAE